MLKNAVAVALILLSKCAFAETLSFPSFQIEIADGWAHRTEPAPGDDSKPVIRIHRPDVIGVLSVRSLNAPGIVTEEILRNLTNIDRSIDLAWQDWGGYSGYQFNYVDNGTYYRHWWLAHEQTILVISYECEAGLRDIETEVIDAIVNSIRSNDRKFETWRE
jgi:hypothetical protein